MVSESPLPDRCGARVTDKYGIEVHHDSRNEVYSSVEHLESLILSDGTETIAVEPDYEEVMNYLRSGYNCLSVELSDPDEDVSTYEVEIEDDDPYITNVDTELQGYCERYQMDNGRCYVHGGNAGPPEGNTNGMTHGLHAQRSNYFEQLDDDAKAFIERLVDSWLDDAPFDRDSFAKVSELYRIAVDQHRLWNAQDEFKEGMVTEQTVMTDSGAQTVRDENPANLPYDRLDRTTFKKLKDMGVLDDPDSQQAEATESLASKFAEME